ncbi:MAG: ABC transporter permease [Pseudomonadota bacterium]
MRPSTQNSLSGRTSSRWIWRAAAALVTALMLVPVVAGVVGIVLPALGYFPVIGYELWGPEIILGLLAEPGFTRSVMVSAWTGLVATVLSLFLTVAILAATFGTRALVVAERLLAPILSVPHAAAALGLVFLFAPSGFILRLLSPWATGYEVPPDLLILRDPWGWSLVAALVLKELPFLFLMALAAMPQVKARERVMVARSLGYGRMGAFLHAVWPLLYRQIRLPVLAVLAFSASVVDVAIILGPNRPAPLSVRVVEWMGSPDLSAWATGSAGALAVLVLVLALIVLWLMVEVAGGRVAGQICLSGHRMRWADGLRGVIVAVACVLALTMFLGFGGLIMQSVAGFWRFPDAWPSAFVWSAWGDRLPAALGTLSTTFVIALVATVLSLVGAVVLLEADRRGGAPVWILYLPLLVPQVAFLFGLNVLAIGAGVTPGLAIVALTHVIFTLPYALIALRGPWRALDARYEQVAGTLGAGPLRRFFGVRVPLMLLPLCVTAALCIAVSVGLYLPTLIVGAGRVETVTTEAVAASVGADRRLIGFWATFQLLIPAAAFALARWLPAMVYRDRRGVRAARQPG